MNAPISKPEKIVLAMRLLYLIVGIGVLHTAITVVRHIDVRTPNFLIVVKLAVYAISLLIIYQVGKGRNWARWSFVGIFVVCLPLTILPAFRAFSHNPIVSSMLFLQLALYLMALGLLFHNTTKSYFNNEKSGAAQEL